MAVGTEAQQRAWLRRAVGHQEDTALISNDLLDDALDAALLEVNRHWPLKLFGSFLTVADQQQYTVLPAGAYKVVEVYWPVVCSSTTWLNSAFQVELEDLLGDTDELGFRYPAEPALEAAYFRWQAYTRKFFGASSFIQSNNVVRLIPYPTTAGDTVYFLYTTPRFATVEDVDETHERQYRAFAQFQLHNVLSTGRGSLQEVRSELGVSVRTRAALSHKEAADRWETRFQGMLPMLQTSRNSP